MRGAADPTGAAVLRATERVMTVAEKFGCNLAKVRRRAGLTQVQLAHRTFLSQGRISRMEKGHGYPLVPTLLRLARALGVSPDDLLEGMG